LLAIQQIRVSSNSIYQKYVNKDYGNIKGITFSLSKRKMPDDLFGASLDYTFQVAEGNETGADAFLLISTGDKVKKFSSIRLDQSQTLNGVVL
jgi:hypothetical protein